jgi:uncharacterized membrane protein YvlD (DUF360 family)
MLIVENGRTSNGGYKMSTFILWIILLFLCWPLALLALVLYPIVWILTLPFRIVGITMNGLFAFLFALIMLPARILHGPGTK